MKKQTAAEREELRARIVGQWVDADAEQRVLDHQRHQLLEVAR